MAGLVTAMDLKIGENRNRGERLAEITPDTGFKLSATVDEYYLGRVREGQLARVEHDGKPWPLKVTRVYPQVKDGGFIVDLGLRRHASCRPAARPVAAGQLLLGEDQPGLVLASGAFLERSGGDWVFVLDADGRTALSAAACSWADATPSRSEVLAWPDGRRATCIVSDYAGLERIDRIDLTK